MRTANKQSTKNKRVAGSIRRRRATFVVLSCDNTPFSAFFSSPPRLFLLLLFDVDVLPRFGFLFCFVFAALGCRRGGCCAVLSGFPSALLG